MSRDERIVALIDAESGSSERVRAALGAAREDLPSNDRVESMLAALPIGAAGAAATGAGAGGATLAKLGAVVAITLAAGGAYFELRSQHRSPLAAASAPAASSAQIAPPAAASAPASASARAPEMPAAASAAAVPVKPAPSGSGAATLRSEVEILREAQAARGSNPARSLALVAEHARSHPNGALSQEREMIRIEATAALGRRAEARALAQQFRAGYPGSAYGQRLDDLVGPPGEPP